MSKLILLVFFTLLAMSHGCFIRNCPFGGKRSFDERSMPIHKCPSCNNGRGICVDSHICCSPQQGCQINGPLSRPCRSENLNPKPCQLNGKPCGVHKNGFCAVNGVCCRDNHCFTDKSCFSPNSRKETLKKILMELRNLNRVK